MSWLEHVSMAKYLRNCLWLTLPPLLFNVAFMGALPPAFSRGVFWHDIPLVIAVPENVLRLVVFVVPLALSLGIDTERRRRGLALYLVGLLIYFLSWGVLMRFPDSAWSRSAIGFMAPAYTPLLWLMGIALVGDRLVIDMPYRWWAYVLVSVAFLCFHNAHAWLVFSRL